MSRYKISIVNYTNTLPFKYGITQPGLLADAELQYDVPSVCAEKLLSGEVDIGLVPVAIIPLLKEAYILGNYCLGTNGKVDTVKLYSELPLDEIKTIYLDHQSRTSVNLVQILSKFHWKIAPQFIAAEEGFEKKIGGTTAAVVIGDRCFEMNGKFAFEYDLATEWKNYTNLPFVFAVWVSNKKIPDEFADRFEKALAYGVAHIRNAVEKNVDAQKREMIGTYLTERISYDLTPEKQKALMHFLHLLKQTE